MHGRYACVVHTMNMWQMQGLKRYTAANNTTLIKREICACICGLGGSYARALGLQRIYEDNGQCWEEEEEESGRADEKCSTSNHQSGKPLYVKIMPASDEAAKYDVRVNHHVIHEF